MLLRFTKQSPSIARNQSELEAVKIKLLTDYSKNIFSVFSIHSLRTQIIRHFEGIKLILSSFPSVLAAFFTQGPIQEQPHVGHPHAHTQGYPTLKKFDSFIERQFGVAAERARRQHRARPATLLDREGAKLMNLWYIPHFTEVGGV